MTYGKAMKTASLRRVLLQDKSGLDEGWRIHLRLGGDEALRSSEFSEHFNLDYSRGGSLSTILASKNTWPKLFKIRLNLST